MKIGYLISNYLPKIGGAEIFIHNLVKGVIASGHEAVVITPSRGGGKDKIFKYRIIRLNPLLNRLLFVNFEVGKAYLERALRRIQKKYRFDTWHVTIGYPLGAASVDFFNRNRIPCVLRCAGEDIQILPELGYGYRLNKKADAIVKENYRKFTALIAAGDSTKKYYLSLGISKNRLHVIPNGVDCARFETGVDRKKVRDGLGVGDNEKLIITVGRNHRKKGFGHIPQIAKRILKEGVNFKWLIVGKGCEKVKVLADKEGVGKRLIIKNMKPGILDRKEPEVPNDELIRYYKASDIFVFPTLIELFAKVLIEAMAAGLPVVTTDAPGADDMIRDSENGLKCRTGDIEGLSTSILRLFSDQALAKRLGENASREAKLYNWSRVTGMYLNLYKDLVGAG